MASSDSSLDKDSLMNEINSLFAPPTAESYGKKGLAGIPSVRRSRKGNENSSADSSSGLTDPVFFGSTNFSSSYSTHSSGKDDPFWRKPRPNCHEYCDSCGCTEGDRLVCDRCPASFHLECLDPPLEPDDAPIGVWFCNKCSMTLKDEEDQASTSSSQSTAVTETGSVRSNRQASRSTSRKSDSMQSLNLLAGAALTQAQQIQQASKRTTCISRALTNERTLTGRSSRSAAWGESAYVADTEESELRALWGVIKYSQYQNPKEFDLPKDLLPGVKLPGSYKTLAERKAKSIIDLENGIIPRPVRRCFVCSRTCMLAPLLPCDYCSLCFHLECLDPPLPHFPPRSDRWMCPNHVEHVADRFITRSIRLTERMQLWSELSNISRPRTTTSQVKSTSLAVPKNEQSEAEEMEFSDTEKTCTLPEQMEICRPRTPPLDPIPPYELSYTPDEEALILAELMAKVQHGRAEQAAVLSSLLNTTQTVAGEEANATDNYPDRSLWRLVRSKAPHHRFNRIETGSTRVMVPQAVKAMYIRGVKRIPRPSESRERPEVSDKQSDSLLFVRGLLEFYLRKPSDSSEKQPETKTSVSSDTNIPMDDSQTSGDRDLPDDFSSVKTCLEKLKELGNSLQGLSEEKQTLTDLPLVISLAEQRLRQAYGLDKEDASPPSFTLVPRLLDPAVDNLRARAVFSPCDGTLGPVVRMPYRQFTIGTSPDCHLLLSNYQLTDSTSRCRFASLHHATVFYDEWTHHFELINYSEYGTRVDGIMYANEVATHWTEKLKNSDAGGPVEKLLSENQTKRPRMHGSRLEPCRYACDHPDCTSSEILSSPTSEEDLTCLPKSEWEGSAIIRHGSIIQFGCYKFVMSLVDFVSTSISAPMPQPA